MAGPGHYAAFVVVALAALAGGILVGLKVPRKKAAWALGPFVLAAVLYASCRAGGAPPSEARSVPPISSAKSA